MDDLSKHPQYSEARRHVDQLKGFYTHALVYVLVNAGLLVLGNFSGRTHTWAAWPALWWGIGLLGHAVWVFGFDGLLGATWEERKVREYLERRGGGSPH